MKFEYFSKTLFSALIFGFFISPLFALGQGTPSSTVDFVRNQIWFSKQPFYSGEQLKIYTSIFNAGPADTQGTVEFYGNKTLLGKADFSLVAGSAQIVWTPWRADLGTYNFYAKMASVKAVYPDGREEKIADSITELPTSISIKELPKEVPKEVVKSALSTALSPSGPSIVATVLSQFDLGTTTATSTLAERLLHTVNKVVGGLDGVIDNTRTALEDVKKNVGRKIATASSSVSDQSLLSGNLKNYGQSESSRDKDSARDPFQIFYYYLLHIFTFILMFKSLVYLIFVFGFYRFVKFLIRDRHNDSV